MQDVTPDEQGFRAWASARRGHLRRSAYLICLDWDLADDLVQETLAKVFVRWRRIVAKDRVDGYARKVLVTTFLDLQRRPWRKELLSGTPPEPGPDPAAQAALEAAERHGERARLVSALAGVPAGQRAVLVLRFFEDLSVDQTAALLGCTTGNVKSQTARGLARLRAALDLPRLPGTASMPGATSVSGATSVLGIASVPGAAAVGRAGNEGDLR